MAEKIDLTGPDQARPGTSIYEITRIDLNWDAAMVLIGVRGGIYTRYFDYAGSEATTLMTSINKANLTVKSLHRRMLEKLIADGKLSGSISGTPD